MLYRELMAKKTSSKRVARGRNKRMEEAYYVSASHAIHLGSCMLRVGAKCRFQDSGGVFWPKVQT